METILILVVMLLLVIVASFYVPTQNIVIAILFGVISGAVSYFASRNEIIRIVTDERDDVKINSKKPQWIVVAFGLLACAKLWSNDPLSLSAVTDLGLIAIVTICSTIVLASFAKSHPPTHDLRTKKDD